MRLEVRVVYPVCDVRLSGVSSSKDLSLIIPLTIGVNHETIVLVYASDNHIPDYVGMCHLCVWILVRVCVPLGNDTRGDSLVSSRWISLPMTLKSV